MAASHPPLTPASKLRLATTVLCTALLCASSHAATAAEPPSTDRNLRLTPTLVIGEEDGASEFLFGNIVGIAVDGQGNVYIADRTYAEVRVYSAAGEFLRSVGREGEGPGEFQQLRTISVDADGLLLAADASRVHVFDQDGQPVRSFETGSGGRGAFSAVRGPDGTILVSFYDQWNHRIVHVFDESGERIDSQVTSFGEGMDLDEFQVRSQSGGLIQFDPGTATLLYAQLSPIEMRLYNADFELERTITGGFRGLDQDARFERMADGYSIGLPTKSTGALFLPDGRLFHGTINRELGSEDPNWFTVAEVFERDGTAVGATVIHERVVFKAVDQDGFVYGYAPEPFPQVRKYRVEGGGK